MNFRRMAAYYIKRNAEREVKNVNKEMRNLTFSQMIVLIFLSEQENYSASQLDIIDYLGVTRPTIIQMIKVMERKGLVEVSQSTDDRKLKIITASRKSAEMLDDYIFECENAFYEKMFEGIDEDEIKSMNQTLLKINRNLEKY